MCTNWKMLLLQVNPHMVTFFKYNSATILFSCDFLTGIAFLNLRAHFIVSALDVLHQIVNIGSNLSCMRNRNKINNISEVHPINSLKWTLLYCPVWESVISTLGMRSHSIPLFWFVFYRSSQNIPETPVYHFSLPINLVSEPLLLPSVNTTNSTDVEPVRSSDAMWRKWKSRDCAGAASVRQEDWQGYVEEINTKYGDLEEQLKPVN